MLMITGKKSSLTISTLMLCLMMSVWVMMEICTRNGVHAQEMTEENCYIDRSYTSADSSIIYYSLSPVKVKSCFSKIPFNREVVTNSVDYALKILDAYSFEHLAKNSAISGSSYSITNQARQKLESMKQTTYSSDYDFHKDVANVFASFRDAHTIYVMPVPYRVTIILPVQFTAKWVGDETVIIVHPDSKDVLYNTIVGISTEKYAGRVVSKIDGMDAKYFLRTIADNFYISKDPSVRMNKMFKSRVYSIFEMDLPKNDSMTITFENGETISLPYVIVLDKPKKGVADFQKQTLKAATRSSPESSTNKKFEHVLAINPMELFAPTPGKDIFNEKVQERKRTDIQSSLIYSSADHSAFYYYFPEKKISMFTITTFRPSYGTGGIPEGKYPWDFFMDVIELGVKHAKINGVSNLILDVQSNGGGLICVGMSLMNYLIPDPRFSKNNVDERREFKVDPMAREQFPPGTFLDYKTKMITDVDELSYTPFTKKFGGVTASYSKPFSLNCHESFWFDREAPHYFSKIVVLTDGLCGSICSQVISKLRTYNKAKIVNIGGGVGGPVTFETSSFCGGAVMQSSEFNIYPELMTNAVFSANVHHLYIGASSDVPREFVKMSGDALLKTFDFTNYDALVDMIAPLFEIMEITNSEDGDQEFVNKVIVYSALGSVAGIGWILACVFCISCCAVCVRNRKARSMTDYVEFKTNPSI